MKFNKIISHIFHPIIFPIIGTILYFIFIPRHIDKQFEHSIIIATFICTYILPLTFMLLFKKMKLITSIHLKTIDERRFPLLLFVILAYVFSILLNRTKIIGELSLFYLAISFALLISYGFLYLKYKISLHTLAIGALIGFICFFSYTYKLNLIILIAFCFILAGVIATSRLKLKAHSSKEVYIGIFIGIITQFLTYWIYF